MTTDFNKMIPTESDMQAFGARLAASITNGAIIFINGPLGVGKTTFARGFLRGLGYQNKVKSPTYTIVEPYDVLNRQVFHFDFYRIAQAAELTQIGLQEYFVPSAICIVEWPEKGFPLLPPPDLACYINFAPKGREIQIKAQSSRGEESLLLMSD